MKDFIFNPLYDKNPSGACKKGEEITYNLKIGKYLGFKKAFFVMHKDGREDKFFEMKKSFVDERYVYTTFTITLSEVGHYWYHFEVDSECGHFVLGKSDNFEQSLFGDGAAITRILL